MRNPVMTRRISQGNRSKAGAEAQAILMSLFRSFKLQGLHQVDTVEALARDAIAGKPIVLPLAPGKAESLAA